MGKISTYTIDTSPTTGDYILGDQASGPSTVRYTISKMVNNGVLTEPVKFSAFLAASTNTPSSGFFLMPLDTIEYDTGGNFSTSTHLFTAPVAGWYKFTAMWQCTNQAAVPKLTSLAKNSTTTESFRLAEIPNTTGNITIGGSREIQLAANDTIGFLGYSTEVKAIGVGVALCYMQGELTAIA